MAESCRANRNPSNAVATKPAIRAKALLKPEATPTWRESTEAMTLVVKGATHVARPSYDRGIEKSLKTYFDDFHTVRMQNFRLSDEEIINYGQGSIIVQPTGARTA